jgi:hypothetical protein
MSVRPDKKQEQIQFAQERIAPWTSNAAELNLSPQIITAISEATDAAATTYSTARTSRNEAKAATAAADLNIRFMNTLVAEAVKTIRLKAQSTNNPKLYTIAQIPAPAAPTAAKPPTKPTDLRAVIGSGGATSGLTIQWKPSPSNPDQDASTAGVLFIVRRRLAGQTGWTILGSAKPSRAGTRGFSSFTDTTLPANPQGLQYTVQGVRSNGRNTDLSGPESDIFSVVVGTSADGSMIVASQGQGLKMAA